MLLIIKDFIKDVIFIGKGIKIVLFFSFVGFLIGLLLATLLTIISLHKKIYPFVRLYISIFRGIPLICQVAAFLYFFPKSFKTELICLITFCINSSAYLSEMFRNFINNLPKEHIETAMGLGLNKYQITRFIIFPEMLKKSIPLFINEIISLSKDVSVLGSFGILEIFMRGKIVGSLSYNYARSITIVGIVYYIITFGIAQSERLLVKNQVKNN